MPYSLVPYIVIPSSPATPSPYWPLTMKVLGWKDEAWGMLPFSTGGEGCRRPGRLKVIFSSMPGRRKWPPHTERHRPDWQRCCSQHWLSWRAREALERWCLPAKPRRRGPTSGWYSSRSGHTLSEHWREGGKEGRGDAQPSTWKLSEKDGHTLGSLSAVTGVSLTPISMALSCSTAMGPSGCFTVNAGTPGCGGGGD